MDPPLDPTTSNISRSLLSIKINGYPYIKPEITRTNAFLRVFHELREKHDVDDAVFLIDGPHSLKDACNRYGLDFRDERSGNRDSVERVFNEVKRKTYPFSDYFSHAATETADDWLRSFAFACNQLI